VAGGDDDVYKGGVCHRHGAGLSAIQRSRVHNVLNSYLGLYSLHHSVLLFTVESCISAAYMRLKWD